MYNEHVKHFRTAFNAALSVLFLLAGCTSGNNDSVSVHAAPDDPLCRIPFRYAKRLTITTIGDATWIDIIKPREAMHGFACRYLFVPKGGTVPEGYSGVLVIRTPVERVTCGTGLHVTMLEELGVFHSIVGSVQKSSSAMAQERCGALTVRVPGLSVFCWMQVRTIFSMFRRLRRLFIVL